jgi:hypothetical protein
VSPCLKLSLAFVQSRPHFIIPSVFKGDFKRSESNRISLKILDTNGLFCGARLLSLLHNFTLMLFSASPNIMTFLGYRGKCFVATNLKVLMQHIEVTASRLPPCVIVSFDHMSQQGSALPPQASFLSLSFTQL